MDTHNLSKERDLNYVRYEKRDYQNVYYDPNFEPLLIQEF